MKIVIDTNVFVSSFFGGNPKKIIDFWKQDHFILCVSDKILDEYIAVLQRLGLEDEKELGELLELFSRGNNMLFTKKTSHLEIVKDDPEDDKFIECAVELEAGFIITGDRALLSVGEYMGIKIMPPLEFLKLIQKK